MDAALTLLDVARMIAQKDAKMATLHLNMARLMQNVGESPFPDTQAEPSPAGLLHELVRSTTALHR